MALIATIGVVLAAAYMLWLAKRVIFGEIKNEEMKKLQDLKPIELVILMPLVLATLIFGFYPEPILDTINVSVDSIIENYEFATNNKLALK